MKVECFKEIVVKTKEVLDVPEVLQVVCNEINSTFTTPTPWREIEAILTSSGIELDISDIIEREFRNGTLLLNCYVELSKCVFNPDNGCTISENRILIPLIYTYEEEIVINKLCDHCAHIKYCKLMMGVNTWFNGILESPYPDEVKASFDCVYRKGTRMSYTEELEKEENPPEKDDICGCLINKKGE